MKKHSFEVETFSLGALEIEMKEDYFAPNRFEVYHKKSDTFLTDCGNGVFQDLFSTTRIEVAVASGRTERNLIVTEFMPQNQVVPFK